MNGMDATGLRGDWQTRWQFWQATFGALYSEMRSEYFAARSGYLSLQDRTEHLWIFADQVNYFIIFAEPYIGTDHLIKKQILLREKSEELLSQARNSGIHTSLFGDMIIDSRHTNAAISVIINKIADEFLNLFREANLIAAKHGLQGEVSSQIENPIEQFFPEILSKK